jgi:hypothetical protein
LLSREGELTGIATRIAAWTRTIVSTRCNRIAVEAAEIGAMAAEIARRDPEGWVVVGALLRPWCRVRESLSPYQRGGVPFVFKDECEGERFAERINARSKGDPTEQVKSMSVRKFAKDAREHADIWRQAYR